MAHSILGVSYAKTPEEILASAVAGFVYVYLFALSLP